MSEETEAAPDSRPADVPARLEGYDPEVAQSFLFHRFCALIVYTYMLIYHRLSIRGRENIPREGAVLVVSNHQSNLDPPLMGTALFPRVSHIMAKVELWKPAVLAKIISLLGAYPIRRGAADRKAIQTTINLLKKGKVVLVFPEGTRSRDGSMGEMKTGAAMMIAQMPDVTILPTRIDGTYNALGGSAKFPRPAKITVTYGKPFRISDLEGLPKVKKQLYQALSEEIMNRIADA